MIEDRYREYYDRLIAQSNAFIEKYCRATGSFQRLLSGKPDPHFLNDYRFYTFTKSTKSLMGLRALLEAGNYEDAIILSRSILECYLSARYFDEKFDAETVRDMVVIPTLMAEGAIVYQGDRVVDRVTGETIEHDKREPYELILGKDRGYFFRLYSVMCQIAHCNISEADAFLDEHGDFTVSSEKNAELAQFLGLFVFLKNFESVVLLESMKLTPLEEEAAVTLCKDLTAFLYQGLADFCKRENGLPEFEEKDAKKLARDMMSSLKEQLGRVEKDFVADLERQNTETALEKDVKPVLLTAEKPSEYFEDLKARNKLVNRFEELRKLIGLEQDPRWHPEGDVWTHTMQVIDRAAKLREKVSDPYAFMLTALCHDIGKAKTTTKEEDGRIRSIGHETAGLHAISVLLNRLTNDEKVKRYVLSMVPWHMKPNIYLHDRSKESSTDRLFDSVPAPEDIIYLSMADKGLSEEEAKFLFDRYDSWKQRRETETC